MLCSSSCNRSFSSHSKTFYPLLYYSLSLRVYGRYCSVRRKFAVLYSSRPFEMLLLTRISRAFESHV